MKARLRKKLLKKAQQKTQRAEIPVLSSSMKAVATECWRIRKLLPQFQDNRKHLIVSSSVDRITEALATLGIEIDDPEGAEYREGMTLEVAAFEETPTVKSGTRRVAECLVPAIYFCGRLAQPARVIISVGTGRDHGS
jgi:hypothetical protein